MHAYLEVKPVEVPGTFKLLVNMHRIKLFFSISNLLKCNKGTDATFDQMFLTRDTGQRDVLLHRLQNDREVHQMSPEAWGFPNPDNNCAEEVKLPDQEQSALRTTVVLEKAYPVVPQGRTQNITRGFKDKHSTHGWLEKKATTFSFAACRVTKARD